MEDINEGLKLIHKENIDEIHQDLLPSPPSDIQKYSYVKTNRKYIVSFGLISVIPLSIGLWLFASVELIYIPISLLTTGYLLMSYLLISIWGKDLSIDEHNEIILNNSSSLPSVDIYLPCCNESIELLENTYKYVSKINYPKSFIKVYVLDDGNRPLSVQALSEEYDFNYLRRDDVGVFKKAGNLRNAFQKTNGDFFVIFDADFVPREDFLTETLPYFEKYPDIAILQTPQYFKIIKAQNWIERGGGSIQELFYRLVQQNRQSFDASICVGSCAVYRREALIEFGGTALVNASEDVHTGFMVTNIGWKVRYLPLVMSMGTCPDNLNAFFSMNYRWAVGSLMLSSSMDFWRSNLTKNQKICYLTGALYYCSTAISVFTSVIPSILLLIFRPDLVLWYNIVYSLPSTFFPFVVMRLWNTQPYGVECIRIRYVQYVAHYSALFDHIIKNRMEWIPTSSINSNKKNIRFSNGLAMLLYSSLIQILLLYSLSFYRMKHYNYYNFFPSMILETFNTLIIMQVFFK
jgi:cellulose synthase/poly-beta-1,6-N-acetylglucosamine synthase-like glycosyltransferase